MRVTIFSTGGKFRPAFDFYVVTRSYSSRPFLCALAEVRNLCYTSAKVFYRAANAVAHCELHHAHGDMMPFRMFCAVMTRLLKLLVAPLYTHICNPNTLNLMGKTL